MCFILQTRAKKETDAAVSNGNQSKTVERIVEAG